jgi:hypothetical protein
MAWQVTHFPDWCIIIIKTNKRKENWRTWVFVGLWESLSNNCPDGAEWLGSHEQGCICLPCPDQLWGSCVHNYLLHDKNLVFGMFKGFYEIEGDLYEV